MVLLSTLSTAAVILYHLTKPTQAIFDPDGQNLFVYFSQSSGKNASLDDLCGSDAVDAVIIGFLRSFTGTRGYPTVDFGPSNCNDTRSAEESVAPGLAVCHELGQQVKRCQGMGKKIFLSIGGSTSDTSFEEGSSGRKQAKEAAKSMWNLFGEGKATPSLRPFGQDVIVDGYDIDHEQGSPRNFDTFISQLKSYSSGASKPIYFSAAPICTLKDPSISTDTLAFLDFIFIRFYNSAECSLGTPGFSPSLQRWYQELVPAGHLPFPKVLLGALSFDNGNTGYVPAEEFGNFIRTAKEPDFMCLWNAKKFGGVMLWDGPRGLANAVKPDGENYVTYVKNALEGPSG
ncbi:glycoside hydrolase family 18 protein [Periconia macrospinosa]|uniref:Glycoside hydrolase family 18 protein n=1 Tax=Periconia macrospinosa TaxID=97972 RepID=A0A2V1DPT3_9PLEO|nr:glycoside hydrolase family 18 protein [Periconia macrospinosa]